MIFGLQVIFMIPIFHQLAACVKYAHVDQVPFTLVTQSTRQVNDAYNYQLQSVGAFFFSSYVCEHFVHTHSGLPTCLWMRHVKEVWSLETAARVSITSVGKTLSAALSAISATFANHKPNTGAHHYGLETETVVAVRSNLFIDT
jgi:hypothetical protein